MKKQRPIENCILMDSHEEVRLGGIRMLSNSNKLGGTQQSLFVQILLGIYVTFLLSRYRYDTSHMTFVSGENIGRKSESEFSRFYGLLQEQTARGRGEWPFYCCYFLKCQGVIFWDIISCTPSLKNVIVRFLKEASINYCLHVHEKCFLK